MTGDLFILSKQRAKHEVLLTNPKDSAACLVLAQKAVLFCYLKWGNAGRTNMRSMDGDLSVTFFIFTFSSRGVHHT